jgi:pimeloyl-ACP methyl ester carboxylesterase
VAGSVNLAGGIGGRARLVGDASNKKAGPRKKRASRATNFPGILFLLSRPHGFAIGQSQVRSEDGLTLRIRTFQHGEVEIAYLDEGDGEPIVLVHGFASNKEVNWVQTRWVATLNGVRRRVIAPDMRGHGASTKLYDPADYHTVRMAADLRALLDHLGIGWADILGYSMGARITAFLALDEPERVRSAILGGLGSRLIDSPGLPEGIATALEAPSIADVHDPTARVFREFADETDSDRRALAACIRGSRQTLTPAEAGRIDVPVLVAVGTKDDVAGSAQALAALIPGAQAVDIPRRDHMRAVGDKVFKQAVLGFLGERP